MTETVVEHLELTTSDGVALQADLAVPDAPHAAAIICHPHPQYGGNRHNNVVQALFDALPAAGSRRTSLRFPSRLRRRTRRTTRCDCCAQCTGGLGCPVWRLIATGYSFGAAIVSALDDVRITTKVLVAPPLASMPTVRGMEVPTLVLTPAHDQFSAPDATEAIISEWPQTTHETSRLSRSLS